jgi:hypothetical protein
MTGTQPNPPEQASGSAEQTSELTLEFRGSVREYSLARFSLDLNKANVLIKQETPCIANRHPQFAEKATVWSRKLLRFSRKTGPLAAQAARQNFW